MKSAIKTNILTTLLLIASTTIVRVGALRVLQDTNTTVAFGGYVIDENNVSSSCDSYSRSDVEFNETRFQNESRTIEKWFGIPREQFGKHLEQSEDASTSSIIIGVAIYTVPLAIGALIFGIAIPIFLIYFLGKCCLKCFGCCRPEPCKNESKFKELKKKYNKRKYTIFWCSIIIILLIVLIGLGWSYYMFKSINSFGKVDCSVSRAFNKIIVGTGQADFKFAGLNGILYLFGALQKEIYKLGPNTIPANGLDGKAQKLRDSLKSFYESYMNTAVPSIEDNSNLVIPDIIQELVPSITDYIGVETYTIADIAEKVHQAGVSANKIVAGGAIVTYNAAIEAFKDSIIEAKLNITLLKSRTEDTISYSERKWSFGIIVYGILILTSVILLLYLIVFVVAHRNSKSNEGSTLIALARLFQATVATANIICSFAVTTVALVFIIICCVAINSCYYAKKTMDDRDWAYAVLAKNNSDTMVYLDLCLFANSTGDLSELMPPMYSDDFADLSKLATGFDINLEVTNYTEGTPKSYVIYRKDLTDRESYAIDDFNKTDSVDIKTQEQKINDIIGCFNDELKLNKEDCVKSPRSTSIDPEIKFTGTPYCLVPSDFNHDSVSNRYSSTQGSCASSAIPIYQRIKTFTNAHDGLMSDMKASLSIPENQIQTIFADIASVKSQVDAAKSNLNETIQFISTSQATLNQLLNCTIMRGEMRNLIGNGCYTFLEVFTIQSILLAALGILLGILAFLMCCAVANSDSLPEDKSRSEDYATSKYK